MTIWITLNCNEEHIIITVIALIKISLDVYFSETRINTFESLICQFIVKEKINIIMPTPLYRFVRIFILFWFLIYSISVQKYMIIDIIIVSWLNIHCIVKFRVISVHLYQYVCENSYSLNTISRFLIEKVIAYCFDTEI